MKSKKLSGLCSVSAIEKTIRKIRSKKIIWSKFLTSQHIFHNLFFKIFHNLSTCFKYHSSKILLVVFFQKFFESSSHHIFIIDSSTYFPNRPFNIIRQSSFQHIFLPISLHIFLIYLSTYLPTYLTSYFPNIPFNIFSYLFHFIFS